MKKSTLILALSFLLAAAPLSACGGSDNEDDNQNNENNNNNKVEFVNIVKSNVERDTSELANDFLSDFVSNQYDLNLDIIHKSDELDTDQKDKNIMISTFSIQTALAMVWAGANGATADEMRTVLKFDDHTHEALNTLDANIMAKNKPIIDDPSMGYHVDAQEIKTSNNLYFAPVYTWQKDWLDLLATDYGAGIREINFSADPEKARQYINTVVEEDTHDRIKDLIPVGGITENTTAVITNAIYFKTPWKTSVSKKDDPLSFKKLGGGTVDAPALHVREQEVYMIDETNGYMAITLPLRDQDFNVLFVIPDEGKFNDVQASLNKDAFKHIFDSLTNYAILDLTFPSFTFNSSFSLKATFKALGMTQAFTGNADFSKLTVEENQIYIGDIFHKTFIGVDEKGVEAAAATAVTMENGASPNLPQVLKVDIDRPFMFVIYDSKNKSPLFFGRVLDPTQK